MLSGQLMLVLFVVLCCIDDVVVVYCFVLVVFELLDCVVLYVWIVQCFDVMFDVGFIDEVEWLWCCEDFYFDLLLMCCVGYWQVWEFFDGDIDYWMMCDKGIFVICQLCKCQIMWLCVMLEWIVVDCVVLDLMVCVFDVFECVFDGCILG